MKNRVNLYHSSFHPKLQLLTLSSVVVSWVFVALFCGLLYFYIETEQQALRAEIAVLKTEKRQQQLLVNELNSVLENMKVDPKLLKEVEEKQQLIRLKERVLDQLAGQKNLKSIGFSKLMLDLASRNQGGLWLTHINLNGGSVMLKGVATDSVFVPKWIGSLSQTDYFKGQEFSDTRLYRDSEEQLNFVISTKK
jgi:Tfp pilus assembly protein PilN